MSDSFLIKQKCVKKSFPCFTDYVMLTKMSCHYAIMQENCSVSFSAFALVIQILLFFLKFLPLTWETFYRNHFKNFLRPNQVPTVVLVFNTVLNCSQNEVFRIISLWHCVRFPMLTPENTGLKYPNSPSSNSKCMVLLSNLRTEDF